MAKRICKGCQHHRPVGLADASIPGAGSWCSNYQSPKFRSRTGDGETCDKFYRRGKRAPLWMRAAVKLLKKQDV